MKYLNLVMVAFQGWNLTLSIKEKSIFGIVWNVFFILVFVWLWFRATRPRPTEPKKVVGQCKGCNAKGYITVPFNASDEAINIVLKEIPCPKCGEHRLEVIDSEESIHQNDTPRSNV